jgi:hypothetical protein
MSTERDRRAALARQEALNGIDFVEVRDDAERLLRVHFMRPRPDNAALAAALTAATITGGEIIATVVVEPWTAASWSVDGDGRPMLDLVVAAPGDFSTYTLTLATTPRRLDPVFDHVAFSFKARCRSTIDCEAVAPVCPLAADAAPPIDYLAKDFQSFRKALSDFSRLRYPAWQERSEADLGVMFMEALASLADDLSYQQDRIAAEAWLDTATQRRSLVRLARLVDYEPRVATAARVWVHFTVADGWTGVIPAGLGLSALAPDGTPVDFETGTGLADPETYPAAATWNAMTPYWWDDDQQCLPPGVTSMWLVAPAIALAPGRRLSIETRPELAGDRPLRQIVELVAVAAPTADPLFPELGARVVEITWRAEDALTVERDLERTTVAGNLVPATQGRRHTERFMTTRDWAPSRGVQRAIVRTGANRTRQFLYTLARSPLAWLAQDDPAEAPRPELHLTELSAGGRGWPWRRRLLEATSPREAITVEPMRYRTIDAGVGVAEIDGDDGDTIRFGDGVFGAIPGDGAVFEVTYRTGGGTRGNVAADAIERVDHAGAFAGTAAAVVAVGNPLPAEGGADQEPADRVREMAPQAFRARQFRAVRAEDYQDAARTLPWVQRAGTSFRYTGSWLSVFTAADPQASEALPVERMVELTRLLDRYRLAGYESFALAPRYASLDLDVTVCARPDAFRGDVKRAVQAALDTGGHPDGSRGFFHPDRFTFGVALERSGLEAVIQEVPGVDGVVEVNYRRRGHTRDYIAMPDFVPVARDEIVRVDNDPSRPERGSLRVAVVGGK